MTPASTTADIKAFFDAFASQNIEQHGAADRLLRYRIALLKHHAQLKPSDTVLDVGCGNGHHLFAMKDSFSSATGVDLSSGMIEQARTAAKEHPECRVSFHTDDSESLFTLKDNTFDVVFCVGALEHMIDKVAVLRAVRRVLKPGGRFVCLTLNGRYAWYRYIAPRLGYETRHLSTDYRLSREEASRSLQEAGLSTIRISPWTFVPAGDMPSRWATTLRMLDGVGRALRLEMLRGGLVLAATKR